MKALKLLVLTFCFVFFCGMSQAKQYYCDDARYVYNNIHLYDSSLTAEQNCRWLITDIIISDEPIKYTYKECVDNFNAAKAKYEKGLCTPVITKEHVWKNVKCKVKSVQGTNRVIQTSCDSEEPDFTENAMFYFVKMYRMQNKNPDIHYEESDY